MSDVKSPQNRGYVEDVRIAPLNLSGQIAIPVKPCGLVVFVHGSGSSRLSPRNARVAQALNSCGIATLLFDLLAADEEGDRANVFDIQLLTKRLIEVIDWLGKRADVAPLPLGLFGASTGAAAALMASALLPGGVAAVVSRGGRPDLAGKYLSRVHVPTLLIVGGADPAVLQLNERALEQLPGTKGLQIVPHATHLFEEAGAMDEVIRLAAGWFKSCFAKARVLEAPPG